MTAIISQRNEAVERSIEGFTQEFQALLEKYDVKGVTCTLYARNDYEITSKSHLVIAGEHVELKDIVPIDRLIKESDIDPFLSAD